MFEDEICDPKRNPRLPVDRERGALKTVESLHNQFLAELAHKCRLRLCG